MKPPQRQAATDPGFTDLTVRRQRGKARDGTGRNGWQMKEVTLANGLVAMVDDDKFDAVSAYRWHPHIRKHTTYAVTNVTIRGKRTKIYMHRLVVQAPVGLVVDHINHNGLDNRAENLRAVPRSVNTHNKKNATSNAGFFGVRKVKSGNYIATVGKRHVGTFVSAKEAAVARDAVAFDMFGDFARLNFPCLK